MKDTVCPFGNDQVASDYYSGAHRNDRDKGGDDQAIRVHYSSGLAGLSALGDVQRSYTATRSLASQHFLIRWISSRLALFFLLFRRVASSFQAP
jgi:hypothetical protein